ncbi:helix-turn-helix transcriptional regulator [Cellulomonas sp. NS3]|uniref:helix-turn-helix transcriptional regulator n=1 Tax=Cellulomonas sp. NS3 TaxID=2973977 RepID=UPI002162047C|nr:helix-turn-helix transcriptional regulator [Cellulomonas sp. NS3]
MLASGTRGRPGASQPAVNSQARLAGTAGVSRQLVVDVERGKRPGTELSRVLAIARALGLGVTLAPLPDDEPSPFDAMLDDIMGGNR